ncbi:PREDICTED: transmembrane protein 129-like [Amphimedon queenslandica]|uniref:Uncharacterized protein n=1 Tax=Amphimedon queenslandica TaxID=400682 RepID=A0A1X7VGK2_AMPQE|nr:PREDICTED: transmembrane protein 129-like [Amphimedon queenslandica]|eukprot:XP_019849029.1 PREDICTED: transmembrane protein 129-like [Amphimedon queenslandica]
MAAEATIVLYTLVFGFYSFLEVSGSMPQEIRSEGLTLTSLFSRYYGDQDIDFIGYHMRRCTGAIVIHSFLPLIYTIGLQFVYPHFNILFFWDVPPTVQRLLMLSFVSILVGVSVGVAHSRKQWSAHPLAKVLSKYSNNWRLVASSINAEYRRIDKFVADVGRYKIVITDSWILKCGVHTIQAIRQSEAELKVSSTDEQRIDVEGRPVQFLTIQVSSVEPHITSFKMRLKSEIYGSLREKLTLPIQVARRIVIRQTLDEQFLVAFTEQVERNGKYSVPNECLPLEPCLGCSQSMPEVKLMKTCTATGETSCQSCNCKPMWCLSCMSKWYASRQDKNRPDTWMGGYATCPLCRQKFCMLDVLKIED